MKEQKTIQVNLLIRDTYVDILQKIALSIKIELKDLIETICIEKIETENKSKFIGSIINIKLKVHHSQKYNINIWLEIDEEFASELKKLDKTNNITPKRVIEDACIEYINYFIYKAMKDQST